MGLCIDEQKLKFLGNIYIYTKCNIRYIFIWRWKFGKHATYTLKIWSWRCPMAYKTASFEINKSKQNKTKFERTLFEIHKLINQFNNQNIIAYSTHMLLTNEQTTKNRSFLTYLRSMCCVLWFFKPQFRVVLRRKRDLSIWANANICREQRACTPYR